MIGAMSGSDHPDVERVVRAAAEQGLTIGVRRFPEGTRTAADAARAIGCEIGQIVKSLVFLADGEPVVALVRGADRVDTDRLAAALGAAAARRAMVQEARDATGVSIGGIPPFGHARPLPVLVDEGLLQYETVWAAAGLSDAVFPVAPEELVRVAAGRVVSIAMAGPSAP
jgi:Cys-tRNA(Pro) deacylase